MVVYWVCNRKQGGVLGVAYVGGAEPFYVTDEECIQQASLYRYCNQDGATGVTLLSVCLI
jgi:hypothetical protein